MAVVAAVVAGGCSCVASPLSSSFIATVAVDSMRFKSGIGEGRALEVAEVAEVEVAEEEAGLRAVVVVLLVVAAVEEVEGGATVSGLDRVRSVEVTITGDDGRASVSV